MQRTCQPQPACTATTTSSSPAGRSDPSTLAVEPTRADTATASIPAGARETVTDAAGQGFIAGLNDILMLGGVVSLVAALAALWLVRERDIERDAPIELPESQLKAEPHAVAEPAAA